MKPSSLAHVCLVFLGVAFTLLLQGCGSDTRPAETNIVVRGVGPDGKPKSIVIQSMRLTSTPFSPTSLYSMPNNSFGKFTYQAMVSYRALTALVSGSSCGSLQIGQVDTNSEDGGVFYHLSAAYKAENNGFEVYVANVASGQVLSDKVPFDSTHDVELRIQQTDTQLVFSARKFGSDTWTPIYTINAPPSTNPIRFTLGTRNLPNRGSFYFSNLRINSDNLGGQTEGPIVAHVQAAVDATDSARAKIVARPPDLNGAAADLDLAVNETNSAKSALSDAVTAGTLQPNTDADTADQLLTSTATRLAHAHSMVATLNVVRARGQLSALKISETSEKLAIGGLLGLDFSMLPRAQARMLRAAFPNIYSWHTD